MKRFLCHWFCDAGPVMRTEADMQDVELKFREAARLRTFLETADVGDFTIIGGLTVVRVKDGETR